MSNDHDHGGKGCGNCGKNDCDCDCKGSVTFDVGCACADFNRSQTISGKDAKIADNVQQVDVCGDEPVTLTLPCGPRFARSPLIINNRSTADVTIISEDRNIEGQDEEGEFTLAPGQSAIFTFGRCDDCSGKVGSWSVLLGVIVDNGNGGDGARCGNQLIVPTLAALAALDLTDCPDGTHVYVQTLEQFFVLERTSTATPDGITIVAAQQGGGNLLRIIAHTPRWTLQRTWFVHALLGNDENDGATAATPVRTGAEIVRRLPYIDFADYLINLLSATDDGNFDFNPKFTGNAGVATVTPNAATITIRGQRTLTSIGVVTAATATSPGTNAQATVTGAGITAALIGQLITLTSGVLAGFQATVLSVTGNTATISNWFNPANVPTTGGAYSVGAVTTPTAGDAISLVTNTDVNWKVRYAGIGDNRVTLNWQDVRFTPTSILSWINAFTTFVSTVINASLVAPNGSRTNAFAAFFGSVLAPSNRNIIVPDLRMRIFGSAILNADLEAFNTVRVEVQNSVLFGGEARVAKLFPGFGGDTSPVGGQLNIFTGPANANFGFGVFNSPQNGVHAMRDGIVSADGPLYGAGNTLNGVRLDAEAKLLYRVLPTITGAAGDLDIDGNATIPSIDVTGVPQPGVAVTSWAQLALPPYNGNAMNLRNGTKAILVPNANI